MISVSNRVAVMEGALNGLSLADILQVVGIGRQFTGVELRTEDQARAGTIFVKSGKVVWADWQGLQGKEAFFRLCHAPGKSFHVFRSALPDELPEPIGSVPSLLAELNSFEQAARKGLPALMSRARQARVPSQAPGAAPSAPIISSEPAAEAPASPPIAVGTSAPPQRVPLVAPPRARAPVAGSFEAPPLPPVSPVARPSSARPPVESAPREPRPIVALTSPKGGTGKTTVALNLAVSLTRQGFTVALVDGSTHGDVVMATDGGTQRRAGVFDVLAGRATFDDAWVSTSLRGLGLMFSHGPTPPEPAVLQAPHDRAWRELLAQAASRAQIVLVDTPAGMLGPTQPILAASTHVLGVLQSEVLSQRSMAMFSYALEALPAEQRPAVLGVLINMVQVRQPTSLDVLKELGESLPAAWLFETTLPRNPAFLEATRVGLPLRLVDQQHPPAVSWLFDAVASEMIARLSLVAADAPRTAQRFWA